MTSHCSKLSYNLITAALMMGASLLLGACSTAPMQAYSGSALPLGQAALVMGGFHTNLISVDGMRVSGSSLTVMPGAHTLVLRPAGGVENSFGYQPGYYFYSLVNCSVTFTAQAGHRYLADVDTFAAARKPEEEQITEYGPEDSGFVWRGYVRDRTAHMRVAMTEPIPLLAEPMKLP